MKLRHHPLRTRVLAVAAAALLVVPLMAGAQPPLAAELTALTSDKVVHAAAFAGIAFFLWIAFGRRVQTVFLLALAIGALHEASQVLLPGREPGLADLMADAVGAAVALLALQMLKPGTEPFSPSGEKGSVPILKPQGG